MHYYINFCDLYWNYKCIVECQRTGVSGLPVQQRAADSLHITGAFRNLQDRQAKLFFPEVAQNLASRVVRNKDKRLNNLTVAIRYLSTIRSSQYKNHKGWILKLFSWRNTSHDQFLKVGESK